MRNPLKVKVEEMEAADGIFAELAVAARHLGHDLGLAFDPRTSLTQGA